MGDYATVQLIYSTILLSVLALVVVFSVGYWCGKQDERIRANRVSANE